MIYIDNKQSKFKVDKDIENLIEGTIEFTLQEEAVKLPCQVSVILVDNNEIRDINRDYRDKDSATDVLSFPMLDYPSGKVYQEVYGSEKPDVSCFDGEELVLGDMVISLEKVEEQSIEFGHSFQRECAYLTVHSVLHLLGYDHMIESDKERMRKREERILDKLNIRR